MCMATENVLTADMTSIRKMNSVDDTIDAEWRPSYLNTLSTPGHSLYL